MIPASEGIFKHFFFVFRIIKQYQQNLWSHSQKTEVLTTANDDMNTFLLSMANQSLSTFHYQYIAAVSMLQNGTIVAWFNNFLYHTAPLALNLVHNAVVRTFINPTHSIHVTNAPFDYIEDSNSTSHRDSPVSLFGFSLVVTMGIALPIVSASYIMFYVHVRHFAFKISVCFLPNDFNVTHSRKRLLEPNSCSTRAESIWAYFG